jgi:hypothetical protein
VSDRVTAAPVVRLRLVLGVPAARWSVLVSGLLGAALCGVPLLGVHGVESALVLGVVLPPLAALGAARWVLVARKSAAPIAALPLVASALGYAAVLWALPVGVLALDALRIRNCAPLEGLAFMVLGPGCGVALGALWGLTAACLCRGPRLGLGLALAGPLGGIALAFSRFYTTPAIHFFGHFYGYFPGTIYDELSSLPGTLWTLRALSGAFGLGLCALLAGGLSDRELLLRPWPTTRPGARLWLGIALGCLGLSGLGELYAAELGHRSSAAHIAEVLGRQHASARCRLIVPRELHLDELRRLADDCDFRVELLERTLEIREPAPITVFVFRSADERRALMGAHSTNLAKPWLHHIYLERTGWPHPVLHHELAHVLLGHVGRGPFRIAGAFFGLWPDPARIEGAAVAAAFEPRHGMSPHEWSRAMLELDLLPPLDSLLGSGFLGAQKRLAYVVTGSVLRFLLDTEGPARLRRAYAAGRLDAAAIGRPLAALERDWHAFLRAQPLSESALAQARLFFDGGSVFSSVCPHRLAALRGELAGSLAAGDDAQAELYCREILQIDPAETSARARLVGILTRRGRPAAAAAELSALRGPVPAAPALLLSIRAELADEAWRAGRLTEARAAYTELLGEPQSDDAVRLLQVKQLALAEGTDPVQTRLIFELLVGKPGRRAEGVLAEYLIRELSERRTDGLASYLEGRQLHHAERHAEAAALLQSARAHGLPGAALPREATRVEAISRFTLGDLSTATALFSQLTRAESGATRLEARDWLARIRFTERRANAKR